MTSSLHGLGLGTAQWGQVYGIANRTGPPDAEGVTEMIRIARAAGLSLIDTARAYGRSEELVGRSTAGDTWWSIATKLDPTIHDEARDKRAAAELTRRSIEKSCSALRRARLDILLAHRAAQLTAWGGAIWDECRAATRSGVVDAIGASAANPEEAEAAVDDDDVKVIQVAASILDQRLVRSGFFERCASRGKTVILRSVFLQGIAFLETSALPTYLAPLAPAHRLVSEFARHRDCPPPKVWLSYARALAESHRDVTVLAGSERPSQLSTDIEHWALPLAAEECQELAERIGGLSTDLLDPSNWYSSSGTTLGS